MRLVSELRRRNVFRMAVLYGVAAWLIVQVAEVLIDLAKLPDWIGTTTLWLLAVGFPIALIFSWFYEITPEGISLEKDVDLAESITHVTGRRLDFIVISLLCAAVILFAYDKWWTGGRPEHSIAVLPFENMSGDPEQEYFSDGISEELLNVLSKLPGLRVVARTSSFQFKGENRDIIDIGRQLNVAFVLEGSVRKAGPQVRITTQLINASNGFHLWSETYDRELENIFAVQDEISAAIVESLKDHLGLQVEAAPRVIAAANIEAHDAYLRGRYLIAQRTKASVEGAIREFEKAISLDPDYALAHAELAIAYQLGYLDITYTEAIARAAPHAERAMALEPTLAEAHAAAADHAHHQRRRHGAARHEAVLGDRIDHLVEADPEEVGEHELDHRPVAGDGEAQRGPHEGGLGDRRVAHPVRPEVLDQAFGDAEDAAGFRDVLAHYDDVGVTRHFLVQRFVQRLDVA